MRIDGLRRALLAFLLAACTIPGHALAQAWPARPVRMVVPAPAGSAPDVVARVLAERLAALWGRGVIVENRPGAGGIPGMSALARASNDGYTIGFVPSSMVTITPLVYKDPQFNVDKQLQAVATVGTSPLLFVALSSSGLRSLSDLERVSKATPGTVNFAAPQGNSLPHLAGEMMSKVGELGLYTILYASPPAAIVGVLSGDAGLTVDGLPSLVQYIKSGKLVALAVTSKERLPGFPDIATVTETYPTYPPMVGWFAIFVPTETPLAIQERINRDVTAVMQDADVVARLGELGIYPITGDIPAVRAFVADERKLMKKVVTELGVHAQ